MVICVFSCFDVSGVNFSFMKYINLSLSWYLLDMPGVHTKMAEGHYMTQLSTSHLDPHIHSFLLASQAGSLPTPLPQMVPLCHHSKILQCPQLLCNLPCCNLGNRSNLINNFLNISKYETFTVDSIIK